MSMFLGHYEIAVVGAGISGILTALQLAQKGHQVALCAKAPAKGYMLQTVPGYFLQTLSLCGVDIDLSAIFVENKAKVTWAGNTYHPQEPSMLVDMFAFISALLTIVKKSDVRLIEGEKGFEVSFDGSCWHMRKQADSGGISADFCINATGKPQIDFAKQYRLSPKLLAIYAQWQDKNKPDAKAQTQVHSADFFWCWSAMLGNKRSVVFFLSPESLRSTQGEKIEDKFAHLLAQAPEKILAKPNGVPMLGVADASLMVTTPAMSARILHVGTAALKLDPLSSQGLQTSIVMSLQAALCLDTVLQQPEKTQDIIAFYQRQIHRVVTQHWQFTQDSYTELRGMWQKHWQQEAVPISEIIK